MSVSYATECKHSKLFPGIQIERVDIVFLFKYAVQQQQQQQQHCIQNSIKHKQALQ